MSLTGRAQHHNNSPTGRIRTCIECLLYQTAYIMYSDSYAIHRRIGGWSAVSSSAPLCVVAKKACHLPVRSRPKHARLCGVLPGGAFQVWVRGSSPFNVGDESWSQKTRVPGRAIGESDMILQSLILTLYQRMTDRQTDRHAACSQVAF